MRRAVRGIITFGTALALTACVGGERGGVSVLGDSISSLATPSLRERLMGTTQVHDHAVWGIRIDEQLETAREVADNVPDQVFVNLGTNDVLQGRAPEEILEDYATVLDEFDEVPCVHVITLNEHMRGDDNLGASAARVNEGIRRLAAEHDNTSLTEWSTIFAWPDDNPLLMEDLLHPNEEGRRKLASAMALLAGSCELPDDES